MCRRYYVEVKGLDPEAGQQQLKQAGIADDAILIVDNQEDTISRAIREVTRIGIDGILSHSRERNAVAARTMYVHFCIIQGDSIGSLCAKTGRDRVRISYYARDYDRKIFGDREFKIAASRVEQLLRDDPSWQPASYEKPKTTTRKHKNRKKKKKRLTLQPRHQPKDTLQLRIQW